MKTVNTKTVEEMLAGYYLDERKKRNAELAARLKQPRTTEELMRALRNMKGLRGTDAGSLCGI